jgi:D-amino-acid dehydrogenase
VKRVVVVGAGVVGLSSALSLRERGFDVTVVEEEPRLGQGCSYGNGGLVVPSHIVPLASPGLVGVGLRLMWDKESPFGFSSLFSLVRWTSLFLRSATAAHVSRSAPLLRDLNLATRDRYRQLAATTPGISMDEKGLLMVSETHATHVAEEGLVRRAKQLGLQAESLSMKEAEAMVPGVRLQGAGAVWFGDDCHVTPGLFMEGLRRRLVEMGVTFLNGTPVKSLLVEQGQVTGVELEGDVVRGDLFVLAAGAWSGELAKGIGLRLPMAAGRGFGFTLPNPPEPLEIPLILVEARIAVTPMADGMRFVGAMELGRPGSPPPGESPRVRGMRKRIPRYLPAYAQVSWPKEVWTGLRPCSPDGVPYVGWTRAAGRLIVATGHAMMGMSLGPVTGEMVGRLACGEEMGFPSEPLSPDRFA